MGDRRRRRNAWSRYAWEGDMGGATNAQISSLLHQLLNNYIAGQMQPSAPPLPINHMQPVWTGIAQPTFHAQSPPPDYSPDDGESGDDSDDDSDSMMGATGGASEFVSFRTPGGYQFTGCWTGPGRQNQRGSRMARQLVLPSSSGKQSASITAEFNNVSKMKIYKRGVADTCYYSDNTVTCQGVTWGLLAGRRVEKGEVYLGACLGAILEEFAPGERYSVDYKITLINQKKGKRRNISAKSTNALFPDPESGAATWGCGMIPFHELLSPSSGFVMNDTIIVHCDFSATRC